MSTLRGAHKQSKYNRVKVLRKIAGRTKWDQIRSEDIREIMEQESIIDETEKNNSSGLDTSQEWMRTDDA